MDFAGLKKMLFTGITINPQSAQDVQNLAYTVPDTGLPDKVKDAVDNAVYSGFGKLWRGFVQVAASGFGKGVLLTAAVVIAGAAVAFGFQAGAGTLLSEVTGVSPTVATGFEIGARKAIAFLFGSGLGFATLGVGGALGAVADMKKHNDRINEDMAKVQAKQFEMARSGHKEPAKAQTVPAPETSYTGSKQPTNGRAAKSVATALTLQGEPDCDTHCQREEERRALREIVGRAL